MALAVQTAISIVAAALAVLLPFVKDEFRLTYAEAGVVVNFSFVGGFLTIALAGLVVDALGDRLVLVLGGLLAGAAAMAAAISLNFWMLLLVLVVMGVGVATPTPAGSVAVRRAFPLRLRGMVMSIRQTGVPFGFFFAALILPSIAIGRGWRSAMVVAGLISIVVALIALVVYRSAEAVERVEGSKRGLVSVFNRDSAIASAGGVFLVAAQMSLLTYLVSYLVHDRRLSLTTSAGFLAIAQLGGAGARVLWGVVSDRLLGGSRRTALLLAAATGAVGSLLLAALPASAPLAVLLPAILVAAAGAVGWNGVQISYLSELARPGTEGRNVGIGLMIQQPGILAGPFVFGLVADLTGSFRLAWVLLAAFLATAMVIMSASRESIPTAEVELA
ncbi:MAG: MFS transporter [Candidatus Dormibacteraeota bacterium]|uniref:MFS transporter n=1 Tax=Candidatus Dormiibacter inghamiae TaxID=3127013 RepID=A0A934KKS6_9BACT|nr:MFS transporter [Candidatus Dormibacteraeota bacterium]MBJ7606288.1 MFS transporter [Candidatus Dormibacteraeota bacterium]